MSQNLKVKKAKTNKIAGIQLKKILIMYQINGLEMQCIIKNSKKEKLVYKKLC